MQSQSLPKHNHLRDGEHPLCTVDQLMFAAINVHVFANHSISCAINVRYLGCHETGYSDGTKCSRTVNVRVFDPTAKSANMNSVRTFVDLLKI